MERLPDGAHLLRGGDLGCARLLVLLRQEDLDLDPGAVVHLETSDPIAPIDLPAWCRITGHGYLGPVEDEGTPRQGVRLSPQLGSPVERKSWVRRLDGRRVRPAPCPESPPSWSSTSP